MQIVRLRLFMLTLAACAFLVSAVTVPQVSHAQGVPGIDPNKCLAGKNKCVSKKVKGLLKCRERCQKTPERCGQVQTGCETRVRDKFDGGLIPAKGCFARLEAKVNLASPPSICTTTGDTAAMEEQVDGVVGDLVATLEGNPLPVCGDGVVNGDESCDDPDIGSATCVSLGFASGTLACTAGCGFDVSGCVSNPPDTCGNGSIDGAEQCDGVDLGGAGCTSLGYTLGGTLACDAGCGFETSGCANQAFPATGQTTCYDGGGNIGGCAGTGQDGEMQAGAALAFTDNGDGTITDNNTGLMWEKKSDDGSIHDQNTTYTWDNAFAVHVPGLNTGVFAGHTDWRVPNVRELQSIVNYEMSNPSVSAVFDTGCTPGCTVTTCSCTLGDDFYWASTSSVTGGLGAWVVLFFEGTPAA